MAGGEALTVDTGELVALAERVGDAGQVLAGFEADLVNRVLFTGQAELVRTTPVDTGQLRQSWTVLRADGGVRPVTGTVGTNKTYALAVDQGREPGTWPPEGELLPWMRRHGIPEDREYLIRRKIFRVGTVAHRMSEQAVARMEAALPGECDRAAREMAAWIAGGR